MATEVPVSPSVLEQEESVAHGESVEHGALSSPKGGEGDTLMESPMKRPRIVPLEERISKLLDRTREGFDLTAGALSKVQEHLDLAKQNGRDLSQLAQERCPRVSVGIAALLCR